MRQTIVCLFLSGVLLIGSTVALAQTTGQPAAPTAAPPATPAPAEQPAVQPPAPPAVQPVPPPGAPARIHKGRGHRFFDPNTVETVSGNVVKVQHGPMRKGGKGNSVRFTLQTDKGPLQVFLGPASYVDAQAVKLAAGDNVQVKGSRVTGPKGKTSITAVEVTKGDQVLKLRDDQGKPLWPRQHRKKHRVVQPQ
jgi:lysyl-tRNA synthetase class II